MNNFDEREDTLVLDKVDETLQKRLVVFNDDVNTFDWVITSFVKVLKHTVQQAEQCATLIHFSGKATVKTAPLSELKPLKDALIDRELSAVIQ